MRLVSDDRMELAEALNKVTEDAIKEQEAKAEQSQAAMSPDEQMSPEMAASGAAVQAMAGPQVCRLCRVLTLGSRI